MCVRVRVRVCVRACVRTFVSVCSRVHALPPSSFANLHCRYSCNGEWVLRDVSLHFDPGCSYGVCGRSGSGKVVGGGWVWGVGCLCLCFSLSSSVTLMQSTLVTALLRLVPLGAEHFSGRIVVDTHDVTHLSLVWCVFCNGDACVCVDSLNRSSV